MKLYGKNPVIERLKSDPRSIRKIFVQEGHPDLGYIRGKARTWAIPVCPVPATKIQKLARNLNSQGVVADVADFPYAAYDELLKEKDSLLFLDGVTDPQNLGSIIRSVACLGGFSIVLPTHDSVEVTEAVLRVACGGDNYVRIAKVSNLSQAIMKAKDAGFWIAGSVVKDGQDIYKVEFPFPLALVLGSEGKGVREVIQKQVDVAVTIPMAQPRLSLNVAQAAAVFCYEIARQRRRKKKASVFAPT